MSTPIGKKIRNVREALGMGRGEFADKTGIIKGSLIRIEVSDSEPRAGVLIAIAQAWPEYATYLLTDEVGIKQKNPEMESLAKELPKAKKAS
ncbi:MAG: helix-turn-helix transcriptional regulator [Nitrosomonadales bacterium]|nr:helix-turn-helix transcriptional regulator [Nitrosomonadales bacterium]